MDTHNLAPAMDPDSVCLFVERGIDRLSQILSYARRTGEYGTLRDTLPALLAAMQRVEESYSSDHPAEAKGQLELGAEYLAGIDDAQYREDLDVLAEIPKDGLFDAWLSFRPGTRERLLQDELVVIHAGVWVETTPFGDGVRAAVWWGRAE